jgi:hypothetical protein
MDRRCKSTPFLKREWGFVFREGTMIKKYGVILAIIGYIVFFFCMEGWGADWKLCAGGKGVLKYYDIGSITRSSTNTAKVWTKTVYSNEAVLDIVAEDGARFKELSYGITFEELNCEDKKVRSLLENYYSKEGKLLVTFKDLPWRYIVPESIGGALYKEICKQK